VVIVNAMSKVTSHFQLPLPKFRAELHKPEMNFAGPGTRLEYRLNDDGSPKQWSQPVDRVYSATYHHDVEYAKRSDTANRNIAETAMLQEIDSIVSPSFRKKTERAIVKQIINIKQVFGLG
jgi:Phospholipase A2-like domain